jgi:uncharacterized protein YkwD
MNKKEKKVGLSLIAITIVFSLFLGIDRVSASAITDDNIIELTNQERQLRGLKTLKKDNQLDQAADMKSSNMIARNYFEHYAFGISPWMIIKNTGYDYQIAGENLAMDFNTAEGVVGAWMKSSTHRSNILNPEFEEIGVGVVKGEYSISETDSHNTYMVTQMLGKKKPRFLAIASDILTKIFGISR